jgi:hypothetical protein
MRFRSQSLPKFWLLNIAFPAQMLVEVIAAAREETLKLSIKDGQLLIAIC